MSQPFIGELRAFGFGFAPRNWALCNGQLLPITQYTALFSLLGTIYGGDGRVSFGLPNLQSRVPMHVGSFGGNTYFQGEEAGEEQVTLDLSTLASHGHAFFGTGDNGNAGAPVNGAVLATVHKASGAAGDPYYSSDAKPQPLNMASISPVGGNLPHANLQPFLTINWCVSLTGIYPARG